MSISRSKGHNCGVPHPSQDPARYDDILHRDEWDIRAEARTALLLLTTNPSFRPEHSEVEKPAVAGALGLSLKFLA